MPSSADAAPSLALDRGLALLELLASEPEGISLLGAAERLGFPRSATHRLLTGLTEHGFVRQDRERGFYFLTAKLLSLAFSHMAGSGIVDAAQPVLDRLAHDTGELVRLSVVEEERLTWVAKAQGARSGLRYDPEMGQRAQLSCSATGFAWLSSKPDREALAIVERQGFGTRDDFGPKAPETPQALLAHLRRARELGYSVAVATYYDWMAAAAAVVRHPVHGEVIGTVSIAGPVSRLPETRLHDLSPLLLIAADDLSAVMLGSPALAQHAGAGRPHHLRKVSG